MPVPTFDRFVEPILRYLSAHPDGASAKDVHEGAANILKLADSDRQEILPSGIQTVYKNRAGWAHDRLKRAGYSISSRRGYWKLTPDGMSLVVKYPASLPYDVLEEIIRGNNDVRLREISGHLPNLNSQKNTEDKIEPTTSPDDRLESALTEIRKTVATELLEMLSQVSPSSFEAIVLDLLHKMGYGANRTDLQRVGGTGDGGIDGIISLDRLGLEKVYVQAKRWQSSVGRPDVQAFYGALAGQRANKGVFITTSSFTNQAIDFAKSVEKIVLVDGQRLSDLMIDYEIGVNLKPLKVPKIDTDYFES